MSIDLKDIESKLEDVEKQIEDYLARIESEEQKEELEKQVEELKKDVEELLKTKNELKSCSAGTISTTDKDARIMKARHGKFFAYNIQVAVDDANHMILSSEVTNQVNDLGLLTPMVKKVIQTINKVPQEVLADKGYFVREQISLLEQEQIDCYVPQQSLSQQSKNKNAGISFTYNPIDDQYTCSKRRKLVFKNKKIDNKRKTFARVYQSDDCEGCDVKLQCTRSKTGRKLLLYADQQWRENYARKMESEKGKKKIKQRKMLSEHPFGTLKYLMGQIPLLLRGKTKVATEINLYVLGYNFKRLINIESFDNIIQMIESSYLKLNTQTI